MGLLILGIIVFFGVHLLPSFVNVRQTLIQRFGENGYKGLFSIIALTGLVLIVFGMMRAPFQPVYDPPAWGPVAAFWLMPVSMLLLAAANMTTNIKRFTRHPMLWGVVVWAVVHLLSNGDQASLWLFATFAAYSLLDMVLANRRGAQLTLQTVTVKSDLLVVVAGLVAYVVFISLHPYLFGVSVI
jgi:uncharacterized membrane protein